MSVLVKIYKGDSASQTYIFVAVAEDLARVPDALVQKMGTMDVVMEMDLEMDKQLVRATGKTVIDAIESQGYYLQLPPAKNINEHSAK